MARPSQFFVDMLNDLQNKQNMIDQVILALREQDDPLNDLSELIKLSEAYEIAVRLLLNQSERTTIENKAAKDQEIVLY